ncbi:hypothetical protein LT40_20030 [Pseudomonas rhizosphaerae]|uniref:Uncharacterized protein n=1 Tax=Pseudomonas rhizosphaerae TaxID=216142 RepID=A0A089ZRK7_9PSED|nr:hypothetical protein LT40_20030 [Pseudomonas rhizosphaerae]
MRRLCLITKHPCMKHHRIGASGKQQLIHRITSSIENGIPVQLSFIVVANHFKHSIQRPSISTISEPLKSFCMKIPSLTIIYLSVYGPRFRNLQTQLINIPPSHVLIYTHTILLGKSPTGCFHSRL